MITVQQPGLLTTIQDRGRWGYQAYGMPVAGVMDRYAYQVVNLLVGNLRGEAAIEMTMLGASFQFEEAAWVAIGGADMEAELDGVPVKNWSCFFVPAGSELAFHYAASGCRSYLAVHGGIDVPVVLGSRSTYTRAGVGGLEGRALKIGDHIPTGKVSNSTGSPRTLPELWRPKYETEIKIRVLLGPQEDLFTPEGRKSLFEATYLISSDADRMGYRLEGAKIQHAGKPDIVSDALCEGAIQVPGHGMPIVMMADRQTTGGYAKIGAVIGSDLSRLAQAKPGDEVRFIRCSDEEAVAALQQEEDSYRQITAWAAQASMSSKDARHFQILINGHFFDVRVEEEK